MKFALATIALCVNLSLAQVGNTVEEGATLQTSNVDPLVIRASTGAESKTVGSSYLKEEWEQATVTDLNIKKKIKLLARFNAYTKEIELLKEKDILVLNPVDGVSVSLYGKTFVPIKLKNSGKAIFAEVLAKGQTQLFRVYDTKIIKAASDATLLNIDNSDKLTITDKLYYQKDNGVVEELPKKKKQIETLFDKRTKEFIKAEKLSLKKEEDLQSIIQFMNSSSSTSGSK